MDTEKTKISLLDRNDFVIVLGGVNDKNPEETRIALINFLNNTKNTNVMISEILFNTHLNERKLNYNIKFICSNYVHATYVDMNFSMYVPDYRFLPLHVCQLMLKDILRIGYKHNYDKYTKEKSQEKEINPVLTDNFTQTEDKYLIQEKDNPLSSNTFFRL